MPELINSNTGISVYQLPISAWDTRNDLRSFPAADSPTWTKRSIASVFGLNTAFDGNLLWYAWDPTSSSADDGITVIKPTAITGAGRWLLYTVNASGTLALYSGLGNPEGVVTAPVGSLYSDLTNPAAPIIYVKVSGSGNTGWA